MDAGCRSYTSALTVYYISTDYVKFWTYMLNISKDVSYTLCPKKRPPFYFSNNSQKLTDF